MNRWIKILILALISAACQPDIETPIELKLNENWEFRNTLYSKWFPAQVPGEVHTDLLRNQLIEDPFIGNNELKLQWISDNNWEYKAQFTLSEDVLKHTNIELIFEGLDTYATVSLNDSIILSTDNAFREWNIEVGSLLKKNNQLKIHFEKTIEAEEEAKAKIIYNLPEGYRIYTRKAQFQYGWDWGPTFNTSGIWRPVRLKAWDEAIIEDVFIKQNQIGDDLAELTAEVEINASHNDNLILEIFVNDSLYKTEKINPIPGTSIYKTPITIKKPKLWWPHNVGEPYLYDMDFVLKKHRTVLDSAQLNKGIRTIDLVTEKDSIGESFYFKVNGQPVYMKGANYIPQNSFQNQVSAEHYEKLLNDVVAANMNMLRVWGGGIYENDTFYDLCDEKGILIWQDFMFACAMYPGHVDFIKNVEQEAFDNIKRIRNHAALALWCGNNENSEGWHRWGWQEGRSEAEKEEIWNNYLKVFDSILPRAVNALSPETPYWESSPKYGRGNPKYKTEGDAHDWWIWHDEYPFEHLESDIPRFMSEFGMQSFPSYETIKYIIQDDSISITSKAFQSHQKHARGFELIREYMSRDFPVPENDEDYVYMSQLVQAYGITKGIEAQRRAKPYNMGTLYWQLNDCWPVTSWSSIDFFGNWKALHYQAKKAFKNILVSHDIYDETLRTYVVNDNFNALTDTFNLKILDFTGKVLYEDSIETTIEGGISKIVHELDLKNFLNQLDEIVVVSEYNGHSSTFYMVEPKSLKLIPSEIEVSISKNTDFHEITMHSKTLQKDVFLHTKQKGHFSDNFFDLIPNEPKIIRFYSQEDTINDIYLKSLNNFIR